jgi:hypothetical protein
LQEPGDADLAIRRQAGDGVGFNAREQGLVKGHAVGVIKPRLGEANGRSATRVVSLMSSASAVLTGANVCAVGAQHDDVDLFVLPGLSERGN